MGCKEGSGRIVIPGLERFAVLQYMKEPVATLQHLYERYPNGGEYGWFALVEDKNTFAYWNTVTRTWDLMSVTGIAGGKVDGVRREGDDIIITYLDGRQERIGLLRNIGRTYYADYDPTSVVVNSVRNGDVWIYTGVPLTIYHRVFDLWVNVSGGGGGGNGRPDGVFDGGNPSTLTMHWMDANYSPSLGENDYVIIDCGTV